MTKNANPATLDQLPVKEGPEIEYGSGAQAPADDQAPPPPAADDQAPPPPAEDETPPVEDETPPARPFMPYAAH